MIGTYTMNGCAPMLGGWFTDLKKSLESGAMSALNVASKALSLYQQGQLTSQQYAEIQKAAAEAQAAGVSTNKTILVAGGVALALVLVVSLSGRNN